MAARNEDGRDARAAEWAAAWGRQDRTIVAPADAAPESAAGAEDAPRPRPRRGLFAFGLVCAAVALGLSFSAWAPHPPEAEAFTKPPTQILGAWVGHCRSGETRSAIPLAIEMQAGVARLIWSRYSYTLAQDAPTAWIAYREGELVGRLSHEDERLHVRMQNFRCGWIEARKPASA